MLVANVVAARFGYRVTWYAIPGVAVGPAATMRRARRRGFNPPFPIKTKVDVVLTNQTLDVWGRGARRLRNQLGSVPLSRIEGVIVTKKVVRVDISGNRSIGFHFGRKSAELAEAIQYARRAVRGGPPAHLAPSPDRSSPFEYTLAPADLSVYAFSPLAPAAHALRIDGFEMLLPPSGPTANPISNPPTAPPPPPAGHWSPGPSIPPPPPPPPGSFPPPPPPPR
jgi:hypothetical protein